MLGGVAVGLADCVAPCCVIWDGDAGTLAGAMGECGCEVGELGCVEVGSRRGGGWEGGSSANGRIGGPLCLGAWLERLVELWQGLGVEAGFEVKDSEEWKDVGLCQRLEPQRLYLMRSSFSIL